MMRRIKMFFLYLTYIVIIGSGVMQQTSVRAAETTVDVMKQLNAGSQAAGYGTAAPDPRIAIAGGVKLFLSILGTVFVVLTVYAGFLIFTAAGNEENVGKAKGIIITSVVGLIIILAAYSITNFIVSRILVETAVIN